MTLHKPPLAGARRQRVRVARRGSMSGRTIIELLVTMMMSLIMLAAVMVTVSGSSLSGRKQDAMAAMTENGQVALSMVAAGLRMTGFWQPLSEVSAIDQPADGQPMLRGCRDGFADPAAQWEQLQCAGAAGGGDALAVRYQAGEAGTPMAMDCAARDVRALGLALVGDRFFVQQQGTQTGNPALMCQPTSGGAAQMLIDDVERLDLRYGVSPIVTTALSNRAFDAPMLEGRTQRYLRADELVDGCAPGALPANSWCAVTVVRICVLMRAALGSADDGPVGYVDCDGEARTSNDRRMRRAISTTVSLRNRTAPGAAG